MKKSRPKVASRTSSSLSGISEPKKRGGSLSLADPVRKWRELQKVETAKLLQASFAKLPSQFQGVAFDSAVAHAMDDAAGSLKQFNQSINGVVPFETLEWYSQFGFIGWQMCAVLAQHWLVDKALTIPAQDAVRHGFKRTVEEDVELPPKVFSEFKKWDKEFELNKNLRQHVRMAREFGVRHTLPIVDGIDYEKPFNIDGVQKGAYRGLTQIDPYWITPDFDMKDASDPSSPHFYEPTWWRINGRRVHRSHIIISRNGSELSDLLKPSYFYGGIPTTQLIYQRVFAAERTANEVPMLALSKRMFTLKTDMLAVAGNWDAFLDKLREWMARMTNFAVWAINKDEEIDMHDTNLAGFDDVTMTMYQLVAAAARIPATKLLETAPKGFNATGEYEMDSYHEYLESIQSEELTPLVERHTILCQKSFGIAPEVNFEITWNPVDVLSRQEQAEVNEREANTDRTWAEIGAIDGFDIRRRIVKDSNSGYNGIPEVVPGGPGDREAQMEDDQPLEMPVNAKGSVTKKDTSDVDE